MKTSKRNIFLLSLFLAILSSSYACMLLIDDEPMIFTGDPEEEFLGVPWGCSFEELQKILDESPFPTKFKKVDCDPSITTYQYRGNHRLPAKHSIFMFWKGKLFNIGVFFFTESENHAKYTFDKLKEQMKKELDELKEETKKELDRVYGIEDEKDSVVELHRHIWGSKGEMSFNLEYGGNLIDGSDTSVILSARTSITLKDE